MIVCGVDEVGRGPWAGPVFAAAVVIPDGASLPEGVTDSKRLGPARRRALDAALRECCFWALGAASVREVDALNVLQASLLAMRRAVWRLPVAPDHALIDGRFVPGGLPCRGTAIVRGDAREPVIGAASIIAKVARDRLMTRLAARWPGYGWETNAGYGVPAHRAGLAERGVTPHHRVSFAPVRARASSSGRSRLPIA